MTLALFYHLLLKGAKPGPADRLKTSESSSFPIVGTPNLPVGSLGVGHVSSHEQGLFRVTPVDSPRERWRASQLQSVFLRRCHPGAAPESKSESRAKPEGCGESL